MRRTFTLVFCYILLGGLTSPGAVAANQGAINVAAAYWNKPAACGTITWKAQSLPEIQAVVPPPGEGYALRDECVGVFSTEAFGDFVRDAWGCALVVHEYGHLLPLEHYEPGVMTSGRIPVIRPCRFAFYPWNGCDRNPIALRPACNERRDYWRSVARSPGS